MPNPQNPYDFVPLESNPPQRHYSPHTQGAFDPNLKSGKLVCGLETETPLFIHQDPNMNAREFYKRKNKCVIPASSLKGLIRNVAEVASNSCLRVLGQKGIIGENGERKYIPAGKPSFPVYSEDRLPKELPSLRGIIPRGYSACENKGEPCFCCALFGMTESKAEEEEGKAAPLAGRVRFTEAIPAMNLTEFDVRLPVVGAPQVWHRPFYFDSTHKLLGRKFYYHQPFDQQTISRLYNDITRWITVPAQKGKFTFTVRFLNLREDELAVLIYALLLEDSVRHHLGYGKAFGLGTVRITITQMQLMHFDAGKPSRYLDYDEQSDQQEPGLRAWDVVDAAQWQDKGMQQWTERSGARVAYDKFKEILKYPQTQSLRYPRFTWFRHSPNNGATLQEYQSDPNRRD